MVWLTKPPLGTQLDWTNPLNSGLAAFWIFNEGMGDKVSDLSGNANTGTLTNIAFPSTPTSGWNPGRLGPAIAFDGEDDHVDAGNAASLSITDAITIEAWINLSAAGSYPMIVSKGTYTSSYTASFNSNYRIPRFYINGVGNDGGAAIPLDTWAHLAFTYGDGYKRIYQNGIRVLNLAASGSINTTTGSVNIGRSSGSFPFNGTIDEVRIYNRALSETEIQELYINPYGMFLDECPELMCEINVT